MTGPPGGGIAQLLASTCYDTHSKALLTFSCVLRGCTAPLRDIVPQWNGHAETLWAKRTA